jgi:hypothetical protein
MLSVTQMRDGNAPLRRADRREEGVDLVAEALGLGRELARRAEDLAGGGADLVGFMSSTSH